MHICIYIYIYILSKNHGVLNSCERGLTSSITWWVPWLDPLPDTLYLEELQHKRETQRTRKQATAGGLGPQGASEKKRPGAMPQRQPAGKASRLEHPKPSQMKHEGNAWKRHPHKKTILIKYVKEIDENNLIELFSPTGTDSKEFGKAALKHLIGVATYNYSQKKSLTRGNNFS